MLYFDLNDNEKDVEVVESSRFRIHRKVNIWGYIKKHEDRRWFLNTIKEQPIIGDKVRVKGLNDERDGTVGRVVKIYGTMLTPEMCTYRIKTEDPRALPLPDLNYWNLELVDESDPIKDNTPEQRAFDFMMSHDREAMRKFFESRMMEFIKENLEGGELLKSEKEDALKILMRLSKEHY